MLCNSEFFLILDTKSKIVTPCTTTVVKMMEPMAVRMVMAPANLDFEVDIFLIRCNFQFLRCKSQFCFPFFFPQLVELRYVSSSAFTRTYALQKCLVNFPSDSIFMNKTVAAMEPGL